MGMSLCRFGGGSLLGMLEVGVFPGRDVLVLFEHGSGRLLLGGSEVSVGRGTVLLLSPELRGECFSGVGAGIGSGGLELDMEVSGFVVAVERYYLEHFLVRHPLGRGLGLFSALFVLQVEGESLWLALKRVS
ncbi:hypothetical protein [Pedobacter chitinilyticus]|nr:hypothetical protein [Pedobacter chitinilyticus]